MTGRWWIAVAIVVLPVVIGYQVPVAAQEFVYDVPFWDDNITVTDNEDGTFTYSFKGSSITLDIENDDLETNVDRLYMWLLQFFSGYGVLTDPDTVAESLAYQQQMTATRIATMRNHARSGRRIRAVMADQASPLAAVSDTDEDAVDDQPVFSYTALSLGTQFEQYFHEDADSAGSGVTTLGYSWLSPNNKRIHRTSFGVSGLRDEEPSGLQRYVIEYGLTERRDGQPITVTGVSGSNTVSEYSVSLNVAFDKDTGDYRTLALQFGVLDTGSLLYTAERTEYASYSGGLTVGIFDVTVPLMHDDLSIMVFATGIPLAIDLYRPIAPALELYVNSAFSWDVMQHTTVSNGGMVPTAMQSTSGSTALQTSSGSRPQYCSSSPGALHLTPAYIPTV